MAYQIEAELNDDWTIPPLTQILPEIMSEFEAKFFLKAVCEDRIIGSVRAALDSGTCRVGRLIIHPDCQRRGIGTRLMRRIEAAFSHAERFELFTGIKSINNIRLYRKLGYREFREGGFVAQCPTRVHGETTMRAVQAKTEEKPEELTQGYALILNGFDGIVQQIIFHPLKYLT